MSITITERKLNQYSILHSTNNFYSFNLIETNHLFLSLSLYLKLLQISLVRTLQSITVGSLCTQIVLVILVEDKYLRYVHTVRNIRMLLIGRNSRIKFLRNIGMGGTEILLRSRYSYVLWYWYKHKFSENQAKPRRARYLEGVITRS